MAVGLGYYGSALRDKTQVTASGDSVLKQDELRETAPGIVGAAPPADAASSLEQKSEIAPRSRTRQVRPGRQGCGSPDHSE